MRLKFKNLQLKKSSKKSLLLLMFILLIISLAACSPGTSNDTFSVNLRGNGGTPISNSITVTYGEPMPYASKPSRNGYTFLGYYDSMYQVSGTKYYNSDMSSAKNWDKESDGTLYAIWNLN